MAACDLTELMPESGCYLCLSDNQMRAVQIVLLCRILQQLDPMASCDVSDLLADAHEYLYLGVRELLAIQVALLCGISTTAGELGASGVHIDTVDPVADPGVDSQIWVNRTSGQVWYWNDGTGTWILLIA
jgi:hypothetical protein